jgi:hypothetical protein
VLNRDYLLARPNGSTYVISYLHYKTILWDLLIVSFARSHSATGNSVVVRSVFRVSYFVIIEVEIRPFFSYLCVNDAVCGVC